MPFFPLVFTIDNTQRHEILLIENTIPYQELTWAIQDQIKSSKNCEEFMSKYSKGGHHDVESMKVHWSPAGRDPKHFPASTIVTKENLEAVLRMMELDGGKDVLEVHLEEHQHGQPKS